MKSGMLAAQSIFEAISADADPVQALGGYEQAFADSWLGEELRQSRNFGPAVHKFGALLGGAFNYIEQKYLSARTPFVLRDLARDHDRLKFAAQVRPRNYPKPDGIISFDRLSSVFISNTAHDENQPIHLKLTSTAIPIHTNLKLYDEPAQRYCPAGVYEIVHLDGEPSLQINAQNCIHCKTCDIKDPTQNINWVAPEGGGGPNYPNM
jgi:electron-transferring-flavoprotein dehydrogenase